MRMTRCGDMERARAIADQQWMSTFRQTALAHDIAVALADVRAETIERCAQRAETYFPRAHTYASENADVYHAQDDAQIRIAKAIRALSPQPKPDTPSTGDTE
jgi:hypothetical protein